MSIASKIFGKKTRNTAPKQNSCAALILSAGSSTRMKLENNQSKQFLTLKDIPLLAHTLKAFQNSPDISEIVVVARVEDFNMISQLAKDFGISKLKNIVAGGDTRADSSLHGILELDGRCDFVAVHDGARPLVTQKVIHETVSAAIAHGAAAPGIQPNDTIKEIGADGFVITTHDRSRLRMIQTPQVFKFDLLKRALLYVKENKLAVTDDCSAVEYLNHPVYITQGDPENIKVTSGRDVEICEQILDAREDSI